MRKTLNEVRMEKKIEKLKNAIRAQEKIIKKLSSDRNYWRNAYKREKEQANVLFDLVEKYQSQEETELLE